MRNKEFYCIWNIYFDSNISRKKGRKISKREAIPDPSLEEIVMALKRLNYNIMDIKRGGYPSIWWRKNSGYVLIEKRDRSKSTILKDVAKEVRRMRGGK